MATLQARARIPSVIVRDIEWGGGVRAGPASASDNSMASDGYPARTLGLFGVDAQRLAQAEWRSLDRSNLLPIAHASQVEPLGLSVS